MRNQKNILKLCICAMMIALSTALAFVSGIFNISMPLGGTVTLCSMLPVLFVAYLYGVKWGIGTAFVYAAVQFAMDFSKIMTWGLTKEILVGSIIFDYLIAYTVLGLAGVFVKLMGKREILKGFIDISFLFGILFSVLLRLVSHIISGTIFFASWMPEGWSNPLIYSIAYNSTFLIPDMLICIVGAFFVYKPLTKALKISSIA